MMRSSIAEIIARVRLRRKLLKMQKQVRAIHADLVRLELTGAALDAFALLNSLRELINDLR